MHQQRQQQQQASAGQQQQPTSKGQQDWLGLTADLRAARLAREGLGATTGDRGELRVTLDLVRAPGKLRLLDPLSGTTFWPARLTAIHGRDSLAKGGVR